MEKRTPHAKLSLVKSLIHADRVRATASALAGASELGIHGLRGLCEVVLSLERRDFYKSMTTYADHRIWRDVYHARTQEGDEVYLKLTVIDGLLIVSFKEL